MSKERFQNPVIGDVVRLRLFIYNSNNLADPFNLREVDIYVLDPHATSETNPDGRCFLLTIDSSSIVRECQGNYYVDVTLDRNIFTIGKFLDVWKITLLDGEEESCIENCFQVYSQLWYTTPIPVVYDFDFNFQPNRIRKGSRKYIQIEITPNVPTATDLKRYYENLAIVSNLKISMERTCCANSFDENLILDEVCVDFREKRFGFYFLDTTDLECGIYDLWFSLCLGGNTYISPREQLEIFT